MTKQEILKALDEAAATNPEIKSDILFQVERRFGNGKSLTSIQALLGQVLAYSLKHFDGRYDKISNATANAVMASL